MNMLMQSRKAILERNYNTKDPLEVKRIQFNHMMMTLNDLKNQAREAVEVAPDISECETPEEIIAKCEELSGAITNIMFDLRNDLEDLTEATDHLAHY